MVCILLNGKVVSKSQDLRGILRYAGKHGVAAYSARRLDMGQGDLIVRFDNGASARTTFECFTALLGWLRSRRSWRQYMAGNA